MAKKTAPLLPATDALLQQFGERLRLARLRRRLLAKQVAERAGMSPMTLRGLERGNSGVTMGAYLAVMEVLGIENDLDLLAKADLAGRELQDAQLPKRTEKKRPLPLFAPANQRATSTGRSVDATVPPALPRDAGLQASVDAQDWIAQSGFASADAPVSLLTTPKVPTTGKPP